MRRGGTARIIIVSVLLVCGEVKSQCYITFAWRKLPSVMKSLITLLVLVVCGEVKSQCYIDADIAILWSQFPGGSPFQEDSNQCLANYTIFNENHIDDNAGKGVTCSRRNSTAATGTWTYESVGTVYDCSDNTGEVRCVRGPGSVTLYTAFGCCGGAPWPNGVYTCCIEGDCISIRLYVQYDFLDLFPSSNDAVIENCSIIPPSDMTVTPQQYTIKMITSRVPPIRLTSNIDCTSNCSDITRGESYYSLIDLTEERYQYSVPYTRSADTSDTNHTYNCRAVFGRGDAGAFLGTTLTTSITASNIPTISDYEVINATAVRVQWSITGDVNGFVINITSSGLSTVTQQLTDGSTREFIYNGLLPERNYTIEVRGYYELLGLAGTITVRLEAGISSINCFLVSVSKDLTTQQIQMDCYTFRVEPVQVTWSIDSVLITPYSSYQPVNGSKLLDSANQDYRHYITLTGSFSDGMIISCSVTVNGDTKNEDYQLQVASSPPTGLSAAILSSSSFSFSWVPSLNVTGYIVQYTPANGQDPKVLNGRDISSGVLDGLTQGTTYHINVYSYTDLPSGSSNDVLVLLDVPVITSFNAQPVTLSSAIVSWDTLNSIIDRYTVSYTRLCDSEEETMLIGNGTTNSIILNNLYPGLQYSVSITPVNILGKGIERTDSVTLEGSGPPTGAPLLQSSIVINSTTVRLSWEEVNCTKHSGVITGYSIQYNIKGCSQSTVNVTRVTSTVITGLTEFHLYFISVAAINNNGIGPYSQEINFYTLEMSISGLTIIASTRFVKLSWQPLMNVCFTYEVAYIIRPDNTECSGDLTTLPDGYTVYPMTTSSDNIEVFSLMPGICYAFGVRAYASISEFNVVQGATASEAIYGLSVTTSVNSVQLRWDSLPDVSNDVLYEVGIGISPEGSEECSDDNEDVFSEIYSSYLNTTASSADISYLAPGTCYLFGVRVYSLRGGTQGEWSIVVNMTKTTDIESVQSGCTSLLGGTISISLLSVILLVLLVVQTVWMIFLMRRDSQRKLDKSDSNTNYHKSMESAGIYDVPDNMKLETLTDNIEMQACEVYGINKATRDSSASYIYL